MQTQERTHSYDRDILSEIGNTTPTTTTLLKKGGKEGLEKNVSGYRPLLDADIVEYEFGIKDAPLQAVIELPVMGTMVFADDTAEGWRQRKNDAAIYCLLTSGDGEPPKYSLLDRTQLEAYASGSVSQQDYPTLEKGGTLIIGRGVGGWLPGRVAGAASDPDFKHLMSAVSEYQALVSVTDDGHLEVQDLESKNGTEVTYSGYELSPGELQSELGAASLASTIQ